MRGGDDIAAGTFGAVKLLQSNTVLVNLGERRRVLAAASQQLSAGSDEKQGCAREA